MARFHDKVTRFHARGAPYLRAKSQELRAKIICVICVICGLLFSYVSGRRRAVMTAWHEYRKQGCVKVAQNVTFSGRLSPIHTTWDSRPITFVIRPIPRDSRPITYGIRPITWDSRPITWDSRPITYIIRPITWDCRPITYGIRPITFVILAIPCPSRAITFVSRAIP